MAKKQFKTGLDILFEGSSINLVESDQQEKTIQNLINTNAKEIRATFIVNQDRLNELKAIAFWQRKQIKDVLNDALAEFLSKISKEELATAISEFKKTTQKPI